jgi:hypothetical protein
MAPDCRTKFDSFFNEMVKHGAIALDSSPAA